MGWFRNKSDGRDLPYYFEKDRVGGLSHLLRMAKLGDLQKYTARLVELYDQDYADTSIMGLMILLSKDRDKYKVLDQIVADHFPDHPPRTNEIDQWLLSLLIFRAMVPVMARPEMARMLLPTPLIRDRAQAYMEQIYFPAEGMGKLYLQWLEDLAPEENRDPADPDDFQHWLEGKINSLGKV